MNSNLTSLSATGGLLRFLTCGSVDDGKSTLIGRLLLDCHGVFEDQLSAVKRDTGRFGTTGTEVDPALLTDGLIDERQQGITIDVAWRYFASPRRRFIIADTPGHEQYTRNMATGASRCDLAVILMDARKGVLPQTRRHSAIVALLGIREVVVAVNKMDLVGFDEKVFRQHERDFAEVAKAVGLRNFTAIPVAALPGDGVVHKSQRLPWFNGPTLLEALENAPARQADAGAELRFPVQLVLRPNLNFRGFAGTVAAGTVRRGQDIEVRPSGRRSRVKSIVTMDGELESAGPGRSIVLTLEDEVDVTRGDVLGSPGKGGTVSHRFEADLVWMGETALEPGMSVLVKVGTLTTPGRVVRLLNRLDIHTLSRDGADSLSANGIGRALIETTRPVVADPYDTCVDTGAILLVDRVANGTLAAGMIRKAEAAGGEAGAGVQEPLARVDDAVPVVTEEERLRARGQRGGIVTLSGVGAKGLARLLERRVLARGGWAAPAPANAAEALAWAGLIALVAEDSAGGPLVRITDIQGNQLAKLDFNADATGGFAADLVLAELQKRGLLSGGGATAGEGI